MELEFIKTAFITLFVALDPPGLVPIFLALTASFTAAEKKTTAFQSVLIAFCILTAAALGGRVLLEALGISIPAFRIAGGLLLFYIAAEMVFDRREKRKSSAAEDSVARDHPQNIAAFPLAIPMMAGPGAITATILQASNAAGSPMNYSALIGILFVILGLCWLCFRLASPIDRMIGFTGRVVMERLLGVLLAAMAVQTVGDGVLAFAR